MARCVGNYLLVLVCSHRCEDSFREGKCFDTVPSWNRLNGRELFSALLTDDVDTGLVLVHGVQNDLEKITLRIRV